MFGRKLHCSNMKDLLTKLDPEESIDGYGHDLHGKLLGVEFASSCRKDLVLLEATSFVMAAAAARKQNRSESIADL